MVQSELQLAASLRLGMVVVVFGDNSLNRIELKQLALKYPSWGTRFDATDLVKVADGMGCDGVRVERAVDLAAALRHTATLSRPLVIEARIDPAQYQAQF
jgi:acetolactate synthase-1/2/3 large subunit